jgi:hypothetical protein
MALGEAAAAIDVATMLLHTGREASTAAVREGESLRFIFCLLGPSGARQPCDGAWRRACLSE